MNEKNGSTEFSDRRSYAVAAFDTSSNYDSVIFNHYNQEEQLSSLKVSSQNGGVLRYGENPHQNGTFYGDLSAIFEILGGKALSYNNLVDIDSAVHLIGEFEETTFVVIKTYQFMWCCFETQCFGCME